MITNLEGSDAQVQYAQDLLAKLEAQSNRWICRRLSAIERRSKSPEAAAAKKVELWEEVRDLRIVKSMASAAAVISYLKKLPLDAEIVESPSMGTRIAMGGNGDIPEALTLKGWTQKDEAFAEMIGVYDLESCAPAYAAP
jgi:hypothetical protein